MSIDAGREPDAEALVRRLHEEHAPALLTWLRSRSAGTDAAEDIVSETLVKAWRSYEQFDSDRGSERAWIFGIARNVSADYFRSEARHLRLVSAIGSREPTKDEISKIAEASVVHDALMELSDDHRQVIIEAYFGGRNAREIGERLRIPAGTVKSRLFYGMKSLRAALEERGILQ